MNTPKLIILFLALAGGLAFAPTLSAAEEAKHSATVTIAQTGKHSVTITATAGADGKKAGATTAEADKADADTAGDEADDKHGHGDSVVNIGHDAELEAGRSADAVVAVLGNASSAGDVREALVAVMGDVRSTGTVGENVVSVLGSNYVDGPVHGNVVSAVGNLELGPHAVIDGDVVAVGGVLKRDPAAVIHGEVQNQNIFGEQGVKEFGDGLHAWVRHCLLLGRPLAFAPHLGWAWTIAGIYLAGYLLIALLFPGAMYTCLGTMEQRPGRTIVAAILAVPLKYVALILLAVTGIGLVLIPFAGIALWLGGALGKAVAFAWIGRRLLPRNEGREAGPLVLATLLGALIATLLYVIPFMGYFVYTALAVLGLGIVIYTLILHWFPEKREPGVAGPGGPGFDGKPAPAMSAAPEAAAAGSDAGATGSADSAAASASGAGAEGVAAAAPVDPGAAAERAGFWLRMAALAIDLVIVGVVWNFIPFAGHHALLLALAVYGAVMWKLRGTTVGGIVCHLQLRRVDGRPLDWSTTIVRALSCFLSLLAAGLGFLWIAFDAEKQAWHDKIAGTVVVRETHSRPLV